ncbi:hypothetical protein Tco_0183487 [Tanacetum coccineum]
MRRVHPQSEAIKSVSSRSKPRSSVLWNQTTAGSVVSIIFNEMYGSGGEEQLTTVDKTLVAEPQQIGSISLSGQRILNGSNNVLQKGNVQ